MGKVLSGKKCPQVRLNLRFVVPEIHPRGRSIYKFIQWDKRLNYKQIPRRCMVHELVSIYYVIITLTHKYHYVPHHLVGLTSSSEVESFFLKKSYIHPNAVLHTFFWQTISVYSSVQKSTNLKILMMFWTEPVLHDHNWILIEFLVRMMSQYYSPKNQIGSLLTNIN